MLATATSREAPNKALAELIAEEETDVTGAVKVEINDGITKEENGLPDDDGPGKLAENGALPAALNEGTPPMVPTSGADELSEALGDETTGPDGRSFARSATKAACTVCVMRATKSGEIEAPENAIACPVIDELEVVGALDWIGGKDSAEEGDS